MMLIIRFIHKLSHLTDVIVHLEGIASEDDKSDPSPGESDHALKEGLFREGQLSHFQEVLPVVFEDLGEDLESVQVLKGSQSVQEGLQIRVLRFETVDSVAMDGFLQGQ